MTISIERYFPLHPPFSKTILEGNVESTFLFNFSILKKSISLRIYNSAKKMSYLLLAFSKNKTQRNSFKSIPNFELIETSPGRLMLEAMRMELCRGPSERRTGEGREGLYTRRHFRQGSAKRANTGKRGKNCLQNHSCFLIVFSMHITRKVVK